MINDEVDHFILHPFSAFSIHHSSFSIDDV